MLPNLGTALASRLMDASGQSGGIKGATTSTTTISAKMTTMDGLPPSPPLTADSCETPARDLKRTLSDADSDSHSTSSPRPWKRIQPSPCSARSSLVHDTAGNEEWTVVSPLHDLSHPLTPPEYAHVPYDPDFGAKVFRQYRRSVRIQRACDSVVLAARRHKYGVENALAFSPGSTPDHLRREYEEEQRRIGKIMDDIIANSDSEFESDAGEDDDGEDFSGEESHYSTMETSIATSDDLLRALPGTRRRRVAHHEADRSALPPASPTKKIAVPRSKEHTQAHHIGVTATPADSLASTSSSCSSCRGITDLSKGFQRTSMRFERRSRTGSAPLWVRENDIYEMDGGDARIAVV